jgi:hypothetical protein
MNHDDASVIIEQYLLGQLDGVAARGVEARAEKDPEFARELQLQKDILQGIELFGDAQMRAKIAAIDSALAAKDFFSPDTNDAVGKPGDSRTYLWIIAAAILLISGAGLWWMTRHQPTPAPPVQPAVGASPMVSNPAPDQQPAVPAQQPADTSPKKHQSGGHPANPGYLALARTSWKTPDFSNIRSAQPRAATLLSKAAAAFQKQDYIEVIHLLEPVRKNDANYWAASELYAHACFLSGKTEAATKRFRQIAGSGQLPFSERGEWFLLLCDLADYPRSKAEFDGMMRQILADEGHPYYDAARKIAEQVR